MSPFIKKSKIVITCAKGIPPFLKEEVLSLNLPILSESIAYIQTEGMMEDAMRLNLFIRTGQRVLFLLESFRARSPDDLYKRASKIAWEDIIPGKGYLSVTSSVKTPSIKDSRFANLKCKDAIVDRINEKVGYRPDSGPMRDKTVIHLYWKDEICQLYLDTSGEPLSRRGYRRIPLKAPMQEALAAATVMATDWKGDGNLINPMCGSGTLAIEAVLIGLNRVPGLLRNNYGFMHLKGFNKSSWDSMLQQAKFMAKRNLNGRIIVTDSSPVAVEAARKNAKTAGVEHLMEFRTCDYSETPVPEDGGVIILNPAYGERLGEMKELEAVYRGVGDFFKKKCIGYRGYLFTGNFDLAKKVGLKTRRRVLFFNGNIECRLLEYDLYEGTKKRKI